MRPADCGRRTSPSHSNLITNACAPSCRTASTTLTPSPHLPGPVGPIAVDSASIFNSNPASPNNSATGRPLVTIGTAYVGCMWFEDVTDTSQAGFTVRRRWPSGGWRRHPGCGNSKLAAIPSAPASLLASRPGVGAAHHLVACFTAAARRLRSRVRRQSSVATPRTLPSPSAPPFPSPGLRAAAEPYRRLVQRQRRERGRPRSRPGVDPHDAGQQQGSQLRCVVDLPVPSGRVVAAGVRPARDAQQLCGGWRRPGGMGRAIGHALGADGGTRGVSGQVVAHGDRVLPSWLPARRRLCAPLAHPRPSPVTAPSHTMKADQGRVQHANVMI